MDALEIIRKRRSVRFFRKDENIPDKDLELILDAGRWAPSARNLQPIEYIVIRDLNVRKGLAGISRQSQPKDAPVSIIVLGDVERARLVGKVSPHDVTTSKKGETMFLYLDAGAAIQNMLLVAYSLGWGSLWISAFDEKALVKLLKTPKHYKPLAIVCLGKPAKEPVTPPKRRWADIVSWGEWSLKDKDESYLEYSRKVCNSNP